MENLAEKNTPVENERNVETLKIVTEDKPKAKKAEAKDAVQAEAPKA
jgi:hypothetical protein